MYCKFHDLTIDDKLESFRHLKDCREQVRSILRCASELGMRI